MALRILLTGGKGMLGRTLNDVLGSEFDVIPTDLPEADITDINSFGNVLDKYAPDAVIHCAAMTQVDDCESKQDTAYLINAVGSGIVAKCCAQRNIRLIAISTDYVFDGKSSAPYNEFDTPSGAATVYGKSKFAGECEILKNHPTSVICRISWLYGPGGPSFVHTMLKLANSGKTELKVVDDQYGNPTSTIAVANALKNILKKTELTGVFHLTCEGIVTWKGFAEKIFELAGIQCKVNGCTTEEFPRPAPRPHYSALDKMRLRLCELTPMPPWQEALKEFMAQEFNINIAKGETSK
ncbi:MAG: dTDP-4-dehydrorhamnose reductase [Lentisphaeria bacterium]|nr:dTDP-4-dehydrorhamnose reductase [Lentisphaeria bacterium]